MLILWRDCALHNKRWGKRNGSEKRREAVSAKNEAMKTVLKAKLAQLAKRRKERSVSPRTVPRSPKSDSSDSESESKRSRSEADWEGRPDPDARCSNETAVDEKEI